MGLLVQNLGRAQTMLEELAMRAQLRRTALDEEGLAASKISPVMGVRAMRSDVVTMHDRRGKTTKSGGDGW
jgi:hypothetical protein